MKTTEIFVKCNVKADTSKPDHREEECRLPEGIEELLKEKNRCAAARTESKNTCRETAEEKIELDSSAGGFLRNFRKRQVENSYYHQAWSIPVYSARRSITGIF